MEDFELEEISNHFYDFLIYNLKNPNVNNSIFSSSIIYQLLEEEPLLKEENNYEINSINNKSNENDFIFYRNQLLDSIINEFDNKDVTTETTNYPLLKNLKNPFLYFKKGLPSKPYYKTISYIVHNWNKLRIFPYNFIDHEMPNEIEEYKIIKNELNIKIIILYKNLSQQNANKNEIYWNFFNELTIAELLVLLGERITLGSSKEILPPSINECIKTFIEIHPKDKLCKKYGGLTVGARALSKHCHRDQTNKWWGDYTGNTLNKNNCAINILIKILKSISWINIHKLPHDINVYEIRTTHGYGARWYFKLNVESLNQLHFQNTTNTNNINIKYDIEFRGFLEPQDIHGHENKWRH
ncbi:hypothetical protein BCR36DRAFT_415370 [Piromyces finnis]|uniref:Uncharacterized protein n=1 Tax=Piromyces finnis TaxID=1754191 RepID=A0A1Y1V0A0_9FUNG|nr:hypothetical protein BCR36DRAFT_415370 [Piromyces finnis]|eukprot:ORX43770.1 hypothetical protein BCR36DRAFT_415370 [Piromyces finnis]